jgi:hypothetical protein
VFSNQVTSILWGLLKTLELKCIEWHEILAGFTSSKAKTNFMGTIKKNPNDVQINQAKTTRPGNIEKSKRREAREIEDKKSKKIPAEKDEGAADESPFDAKSNNMHKKR